MEADIEVTDTDGPVVNEAVFHDIPKVDEAPENNNPNDALEADEKDAMMQVDADGELVTNSMENIVEILDDIEQQIERLRASASRLLEERDDLLTTLETVSHADNLSRLDEVERGEVSATVSRLAARAGTVAISLTTARGESQSECLFQVNSVIDELIVQIQTDCDRAEDVCRRFISACDIDSGGRGVDSKFEKMLLGCTAEDQKVIKKRLVGLLEHIIIIKNEAKIKEC